MRETDRAGERQGSWLKLRADEIRPKELAMACLSHWMSTGEKDKGVNECVLLYEEGERRDSGTADEKPQTGGRKKPLGL